MKAVKEDTPRLTIDTEKNQYLIDGQSLTHCAKLTHEKVGADFGTISMKMIGGEAAISSFLIKKKPQKIICECGAYLGKFINHYDIACPYCRKKFTGKPCPFCGKEVAEVATCQD